MTQAKSMCFTDDDIISISFSKKQQKKNLIEMLTRSKKTQNQNRYSTERTFSPESSVERELTPGPHDDASTSQSTLNQESNRKQKNRNEQCRTRNTKADWVEAAIPQSNCFNQHNCSGYCQIRRNWILNLPHLLRSL